MKYTYEDILRIIEDAFPGKRVGGVIVYFDRKYFFRMEKDHELAYTANIRYVDETTGKIGLISLMDDVDYSLRLDAEGIDVLPTEPLNS